MTSLYWIRALSVCYWSQCMIFSPVNPSQPREVEGGRFRPVQPVWKAWHPGAHPFKLCSFTVIVYPVTKLSSECDRWCSSKAMQGSNPGGPGPRDTVRSSRRKTPENCQEWDKVFTGFKYGGLENDGLPRSSPCFPNLQCCYMILSAPGPLVWSRMFSHNRREGNITWANERKMSKYSDLQQECEDGGRRCQVFPVEAGCLLCMAPYSSQRPHTREALRKAQEAAESASA